MSVSVTPLLPLAAASTVLSHAYNALALRDEFKVRHNPSRCLTYLLSHYRYN